MGYLDFEYLYIPSEKALHHINVSGFFSFDSTPQKFDITNYHPLKGVTLFQTSFEVSFCITFPGIWMFLFSHFQVMVPVIAGHDPLVESICGKPMIEALMMFSWKVKSTARTTAGWIFPQSLVILMNDEWDFAYDDEVLLEYFTKKYFTVFF